MAAESYGPKVRPLESRRGLDEAENVDDGLFTVPFLFPISLGVLLIPQKGPPLSVPTGYTTTPHGLSSRLLLDTGSGVGTVEETG